MKKFLIIFLLTFVGVCSFANERVKVSLARVYDGDTIEILNENNQKEIIRFLGIDCYESKPNQRSYRQAYENNIEISEVVAEGTKSTLALVKLFKDNPTKNLYLVRYGKDNYNRTLGILFLGKMNINNYMLKSGNALKYTHIKY
ncbi:TPA: hypothetical protein CPT80_01905 [Candidatus Gastranaerophilales bacterium HUM_9]|nr:MAG TPA: hypothetical protein CPT80_01905 [Candidatus Gastranaerophilales bacterium HUM_9]HBX34220.1 hypothetical protein [Cyanobacteria bacterium UBA11440]